MADTCDSGMLGRTVICTLRRVGSVAGDIEDGAHDGYICGVI